MRTYAARQQLPHRWVEIDTPTGAALARAVTAAGGDLPVVITPTAVLRHATPALLAGHLGLSYHLCVPKTSSMILTSRVASRPSGRDDHRSCACGSVFLLITWAAAGLRLSRREAWKTAQILILRHQLAVLQRRQPRHLKLNWADRALLATLLGVIPKARRQGLRLLVTPDTIVR